MGTKSSKDENLNNYIHPRLGKIVRLQSYVIVEGVQIVQKWQDSLKKFNNQTCRQFLFWPNSYTFEKAGMCGNGGNIVLKYGDFMFTLQPQIKNRMQIKRPFKQVQIWYMLYILVKLQSIFQEQGIKIGDIRPKNILVNQEGQLQVLSQFSWPGQYDNLKMSYEDSQQKVYLAPQECKLRRTKKQDNKNLNVNKAQLFSIGITILQACSLMDCANLYTQKYVFNQFKLRQYIDSIDNKYSKVLIKIILSMLKINPQSRKSAKQFINVLIQYEQKLLGLNQLSQQQKQTIQNIFFQQVYKRTLSTQKHSNKVNNIPITNNTTLNKKNSNYLTTYPYFIINPLPLLRTQYYDSTKMKKQKQKYLSNNSFYNKNSHNYNLNRPITKVCFNSVQ